MRVFANIALYAYIPFVLALFALIRNHRHAVIAAYLIGWEFLPMDFIKLPILELSKPTACSFGVILGMALFDFPRITSFRPRWYDLPMLLWCICPYITSMENDLGAFDGASSAATQTLLWGVPYFVGRVYFNDLEGLRELAIGIFIAALAYVPFCLYEAKMSPQLHRMVYGHFQHDFSQTYRFGGWRPMVFMQHGIATGMWMCMASMIGVWLWLTGTVRRLFNFPMGFLVVVLLITTLLCRSLTALLFMAMGLGALFWVRWFRYALVVYVLLAVVPAYMYIRAGGIWKGQEVIDAAENSFGEDRAQSLGTRIKAENKLTEKALDPSEHDPWFGFGKWSPYLTYAPWRVGHTVEKVNIETKEVFRFFKDDAPTDGMWVITLGTFGLLGLTAGTVTIQLPVLLARKRLPLVLWAHPLGAPAAVLAVMLALHMIDNLLNYMINPVFILAMGGLSALGARGTRREATQAMRPMPPLGRPAPIGASNPRSPADPTGGGMGFPSIPGLQIPPALPFGFPGAGGGGPTQQQGSTRASQSRTTPVGPGGPTAPAQPGTTQGYAAPGAQ